MSKAGNTTVIGEWDIDAAAQSSYMRDFAALLAFYERGRGPSRSREDYTALS